ncbi:acyl-CoA thioesterase [[Mycobacterium] wendilense]|uniref:Thioesterase family protein n=1 Tax=[Mycobacterium] wendilense TaxID=3064284 RepID=A0ABN9P8W4_9MYCO|nr:acyl-CoA thioesterase domain-containing protein [Mycolicibacterium sp. MU0050]CAJ1587291.1 thioesterase family protein [Mycolicibacterium sp. MU0050]
MSHTAAVTDTDTFTGALLGSGSALESRVLEVLGDIESALRLERIGPDRFRAGSEADRFGSIFGGQLLAQAHLAAAATVEGQTLNSLHAYFTRPGALDEPVEIVVSRTRDGRALSTRHVELVQSRGTVLTAVASFHDNPDAPEQPAAPPQAPAPLELPLLQHWASRAPAEAQDMAQTWIEVPPPLEMRIGEAPNFLGGQPARGPRAHWMRLPRSVGDDPALHHAMITYASDYLLVDMAFREYPEPIDWTQNIGVSLDHAIWLHRPARFDQWHLYTQESVTMRGHRALVRGSIVDAAGALVASVAQEVMIRPHPAPSR